MTFTSFPLHVSAIPDVTLSAAQVWFDWARHRVIAIHHQPVSGGVRGDLTLHSLPSDLKHAGVRIAPSPNERWELQGWVWTRPRRRFGR